MIHDDRCHSPDGKHSLRSAPLLLLLFPYSILIHSIAVINRCALCHRAAVIRPDASRIKLIPVPVVQKPAGSHIPGFIKIIPIPFSCILRIHPGMCSISSVFEPVPPADLILHPRSIIITPAAQRPGAFLCTTLIRMRCTL